MLPPDRPAWDERFQLRPQASPQAPPQLVALHAGQQYVPVVRLQVHAWDAHVRHHAEVEGAHALPQVPCVCMLCLNAWAGRHPEDTLAEALRVECVVGVEQVTILPDGIAQRWRQALGHRNASLDRDLVFEERLPRLRCSTIGRLARACCKGAHLTGRLRSRLPSHTRVPSWSPSCPCRPCPCPSPLLQLAGKAPELSRDSYGGQSAASRNP